MFGCSLRSHSCQSACSQRLGALVDRYRVRYPAVRSLECRQAIADVFRSGIRPAQVEAILVQALGVKYHGAHMCVHCRGLRVVGKDYRCRTLISGYLHHAKGYLQCCSQSDERLCNCRNRVTGLHRLGTRHLSWENGSLGWRVATVDAFRKNIRPAQVKAILFQALGVEYHGDVCIHWCWNIVLEIWV